MFTRNIIVKELGLKNFAWKLTAYCPTVISRMDPFFPSLIVSGGQTGVDRGALDAALALGIEHGGWCPMHRQSEDGSIPSRYQLVELDGGDYAKRTEQNVIDSDATLVLYEGPLIGGTRLTVRFASLHAKPCLTQPLGRKFDPQRVRQWLAEIQPRSLNIAGPRESKYPGICEKAFAALLEIFEQQSKGNVV